MHKPVPIADNLFTWPSDAPQLIGSRCLECDTFTFPLRGSCPACCSEHVERILLPRRGVLWTWTIQAFPPKSPPYLGASRPEDFQPYGVGYVQLGQTTRVEGRLTVTDPAQLRIGMQMEVVLLPLRIDEAGNEVVTYGFRALPEEPASAGVPE